MKDLRGRTAVMTGGGSGIARAMCLAFAAEGMNVVVADLEDARQGGLATSRLQVPRRIDETARMAKEPDAPLMAGADLSYLGQRQPEQTAACVVDGVKANRLYIFSHAPGRIATEARFKPMLEAFDHAP